MWFVCLPFCGQTKYASFSTYYFHNLNYTATLNYPMAEAFGWCREYSHSLWLISMHFSLSWEMSGRMSWHFYRIYHYRRRRIDRFAPKQGYKRINQHGTWYSPFPPGLVWATKNLYTFFCQVLNAQNHLRIFARYFNILMRCATPWYTQTLNNSLATSR